MNKLSQYKLSLARIKADYQEALARDNERAKLNCLEKLAKLKASIKKDLKNG